MELVTIAVVGVIVVVLVTTVAPKIGIASPLVLVVLGVGVSLLPMVPPLHVEPELILGGILPPLLYSTAVNTPVMEFRRDLRIISIFAVLLVAVSAVAVGFLLVWLVPGLPLGIGIAVGAVVSPTDAVATTIVRKSGASSRLLRVLEGEALFNDATALVLLRSAVAATAAGFSFWRISIEFVYAVVVALIVGFVVGRINVAVRSRIPHVASNVAFSLAVPFLAYVPAEHLRASGLVAAAMAGLITGHRTPKRLPSQIRIAERAVWETANLILESAIFLLMGMQLRALLMDIHYSTTLEWLALELGVASALIVLAARTVFVSASVWLLARRTDRVARRHERIAIFTERVDQLREADTDDQRRRRVSQRRWSQFKTVMSRRAADLDYLTSEQFGWKDGVILVAAGMRGAITLAAAQSLPNGTPNRSLLILTSFVVAAGTLLIQGGTLSTLVKALIVEPRDTKADEVLARHLDVELNQAALKQLDSGKWHHADGTAYSEESFARARSILETNLDAKRVRPRRQRSHELAALRLEILEAQRAELLRIRDVGSYPGELLTAKLAQLDADQISIESRQQ
ncbi:MAG: sodium:proton antiporter [Micrococcales bacterium]|nr:sodium:proton antiporter [Micrococcales bacterium]